ncbi:MAG: hypothetical protein [Olavius algarvensis Gamma 1 endosymbiont]|nr:MAG: hypothetical protein [Olavius algarvensis Gamma 1 endosymbiont]
MGLIEWKWPPNFRPPDQCRSGYAAIRREIDSEYTACDNRDQLTGSIGGDKMGKAGFSSMPQLELCGKRPQSLPAREARSARRVVRGRRRRERLAEVAKGP